MTETWTIQMLRWLGRRYETTMAGLLGATIIAFSVGFTIAAGVEVTLKAWSRLGPSPIPVVVGAAPAITWTGTSAYVPAPLALSPVSSTTLYLNAPGNITSSTLSFCACPGIGTICDHRRTYRD